MRGEPGSNNSEFVKHSNISFMTQEKSSAPFTIREKLNKTRLIWGISDLKSVGITLLIVVGVALLLTFLQPFGMTEIGIVKAGSYWIVCCLVGWAVYAPVFHHGELLFSKRLSAKNEVPRWLLLVILSIIAGLLMSFVVPFLTRLFFGYSINYLDEITTLLPRTLAIGGLISVISFTLERVQKQDELIKSTSHEDNKNNGEQFQQQLPKHLRGKLICLEIDDHYLKVHTDKGSHMLLLRMKDAIQALGSFPGLQVHRSWWVAEDAVVGSVKDGRSTVLKLENGLQVPVSRSYQAEVKSRILGR